MLRMQDFEFFLKYLKIFMWGHVPKPSDKFGRLHGPPWESRNLEGKAKFLFHFPLGNY